MPRKRRVARRRKKKRRGLFRNSLNPKLGIPLLLIAVVLLVSPFIAEAYASYRQSILLQQYRDSFAPKPEINFSVNKGAPTGFEGVILEIPRLELEVAILPPPDSFDDYMRLLLQSPVFLRGSVYPGAQGIVSMTAHRIDHGNYFYDLDFMEKGDKIYLKTPGYSFEYTVFENKIINEYDTHYVDNHGDKYILALVTCEPKTTRQPTPYRLLVRAELEKVERN